MGRKIPVEKGQRIDPGLLSMMMVQQFVVNALNPFSERKQKHKPVETTQIVEVPRVVAHKPRGSALLWSSCLPADFVSGSLLPVLGLTEALNTLLRCRWVSKAWRQAWDGSEVWISLINLSFGPATATCHLNAPKVPDTLITI